AGTAPLSVPRCEVISVMGWSPRAVTVHLSPAVSYASGPFTRLRAVHPSPGRSPASGPLARIVSGAAAAAEVPGAQALGPHDVGDRGSRGGRRAGPSRPRTGGSGPAVVVSRSASVASDQPSDS